MKVVPGPHGKIFHALTTLADGLARGKLEENGNVSMCFSVALSIIKVIQIPKANFTNE